MYLTDKSLRRYFQNIMESHIWLPRINYVIMYRDRELSHSSIRQISDVTLYILYTLAERYNDVIMRAMASQITSFITVYSTVYSRLRSKKTSKLRHTGLCEGNSLVTGKFPAKKASNADNISIWWCHQDILWMTQKLHLRSHCLCGTCSDII